MTAAFILSKVYVGVVAGSDTFVDCERIARDTLSAARTKLPDRSGWEFCYRPGSQPAPPGAVLIGAVASREPTGCDLNLFVYPAEPHAIVLKDRMGDYL